MRVPVLSFAVVFMFAPAVRADDAADARAIIEKAAKALGHKPDAQAGPMAWKEKGTFTGGGFKMDYTSDWVFQGPDRMRFDMASEFGGMKIAFSVAVNGDKAWESAFGKVQDITGDKLDYIRDEAYQIHVTSLQPLLSDKGFTLATAGTQDVNGKKAVGVKVTREKRPTVTIYFDKATGLPVKAEMTVKDEFQKWKEVPQEVYFDDFKDTNGKKMFTRMRIVRDGKTMIESTLSDAKTPDKLDPKLFDKPEAGK